MKKIFMLFTLICAGCAAQQPTIIEEVRYLNKNGKTEEDLLKDRYACYLEVRQRISESSSGGYGDAYGLSYSGNSYSVVIPSCSGINACLAAKGYIRSNEGNLYVPPAAHIECH